MRDLIKRLIDDLIQGESRILCQVVETRGSTPQKAGAYMIVAPDGRQWGTLGGGCVENEVKTRSLMTLGSGQTQIHSYVLDHDYAWADGLICGGRMVIASQLIENQELVEYCRIWLELDQAGLGYRETVVQNTNPELGTKLGQRFLMDHEGHLAASWNGEVTDEALEYVRRANVTVQKPFSGKGLSIILWPAQIQLVIVGAGHVGQAVADLAAKTGFDVIVVDDRPEFANAGRFPSTGRFVVGPFEQTLSSLEITQRTFVLIVTRGHGHDQEALGLVADSAASYVGLIGSRRKIRMIMQALLEEGVPEKSLNRVRAPIGLPIGSQSVDEIAVSVVAELIAWRNLGESAAREISDKLQSKAEPDPLPEHARAEVSPRCDENG
jgi:xanthine dehydrogenase accessory factor